MVYIAIAILLMINIFLGGMLVQVILTPKDNVIITEAECPEPPECKPLIVREGCDPEAMLDSCINEKFEYGDQINAINRIINPDYYMGE